MGDLIDFPEKPATKRAGRVPHAAAAGATILLFTGIRYERMAEPAPERGSPDPKKPRGRRRA